ncbi:hypothetical protein ACOMHN_057739 [Nucella lapillus]
MKGRAVEEVVDYFSYMQEVTNAHATELIWTLCDLSPYPRRVLPRAVWKRHSTGVEHEQLLSAQSGVGSSGPCGGSRNRLWNSDVLNPGPWGAHSKLPGLPPMDLITSHGPLRKNDSPVPAHRTRRPENTEVKNAAVPKYPSQPFSRNAYHVQQPHRHPAHKGQPHTQQPHRRENRISVSRYPEQAGGHFGDGPPSPDDINPAYKMLPVPAPREEKMAANHPAKLAEELLLLHQSVKQRKQTVKPEKNSEGHGDQRDKAKDSSSSSEETESSSSKSKMSSSCTTEQTESVYSESPAVEKNIKVGKCARGHAIHTKEVRTERRENVDQVICKSQRRENAQEKVEQLLSKESSASRYKAASSVLEKFAKSYFTNHRQQEHEESPNPPSDVSKGSAAVPVYLKSRKALQTPHKTTGTQVTRKHSKTNQKTEPENKDLSDTPKTAEAKQNVQKEPYDSAVLRAIKDEEESKASETTSESILSTVDSISEPSCSDSRCRKTKTKATGDAENSQTTIHEAGRRLAKLRKRLEDSIQLIQSQPGLDKELLEKARSSKMRRRRDQLETMFIKEDIMELTSLCGDKDSQYKSDSDLKTQSEMTISSVSSVQTDAGRISTYQQTSLSECSQTSQEVCDGEPSFPARRTQPALPNMEIPGTSAGEPQGNRATGKFAYVKKEMIESSHLASYCTAEEKTAHDETGNKKERANLGSDNTVSSKKVAEPSANLHKETLSEQAGGSADKSEGNSPADSQRKTQSKNEEPKSESIRFLSGSGKILDEGRLDAILERQSKRREDLRQRKRMHIDSVLAGKAGRSDVSAENSNQDLLPASERQAQATHLSEQHAKSENDGSVKENSKASSPVVIDGTSCLGDSKAKATDKEDGKHSKGESSQDSGSSRTEQPPLLDMSGFSPYVSTRSLGHLKYEEPEVQLSKGDSKSTPLSEMNGDLPLGIERESSARRRVRWRRQAERAEKQRNGFENQKTPPPVPPKVTRLIDIVDNEIAASHNLHQEAKTVDANPENYKIVDSKEMKASEAGEGKTNLAKPSVPDATTLHLLPSLRLGHGSYLSTLRDKNTLLAAGETGLVKGPPDNVEICEEKSLTPSKAASVFDPKAQLEKEKEKQEAERALRASNREGMPSPQFRANIRLFEQAIEAPGDKATVDSKVKANVKMFEYVSNPDGAQLRSPERKRNERKSRSRSPRPNLEPVLVKDQ